MVTTLHINHADVPGGYSTETDFKRSLYQQLHRRKPEPRFAQGCEKLPIAVKAVLHRPPRPRNREKPAVTEAGQGFSIRLVESFLSLPHIRLSFLSAAGFCIYIRSNVYHPSSRQDTCSDFCISVLAFFRSSALSFFRSFTYPLCSSLINYIISIQPTRPHPSTKSL